MRIVYCDYELSKTLEKELEMLETVFPGCEVECCRYIDDRTLAGKLREADGFLTANLRVSRRVLQQTERLKVISVDSVGCWNVDTAAAGEKGILVCSMGEYCTEEVADHGMLLILMLEKQVKQYMRYVEETHIYNYRVCPPRRRISGKRLAIFGYGRVGRQLAVRANAFGYEITAVPHDRLRIGSAEGEVCYISADEAFETADVIVNSMSETTETFEYFNREAFAKMKRCPLFINLARGSAVNETDLLEALKKKKVAGAGLDVLKEVHPDLETCPLLGLEQVVITPHMAFYSVEAMESIKSLPVKNLIYGLTGENNKITSIAR